jgi:2-polyprenyl-3-methyl-5-hydroxy-6-metoxy-1,4-benzoquinol methylase
MTDSKPAVQTIDAAKASEMTSPSARKLRFPFRWSDIWKAPLHDVPIRDEILYQFLPLSPEMDVLEVSPGSGFTAFSLAQQVRSLTVLDVSVENIARLRHVLKDLPNLEFISPDVCSPMSADSGCRQFDAISGLEVQEYVPDPKACFKSLAAMLAKGGCLLMQWPNYPSDGTGAVTHFDTVGELGCLLESAGFEEWALFSLRLRPYAGFLFRAFHEKPLRLYQRSRSGHREKGAQAFDQTWAFRNGQRLERYKGLLHAAWTVLLFALGLGGDCFERTLIKQGSAQRNLLLVARRQGGKDSNREQDHKR